MSHVAPIDPAPVARPDLPSKDEPTIGRLVSDATRDVSTLVRSEIALARWTSSTAANVRGSNGATVMVRG